MNSFARLSVIAGVCAIACLSAFVGVEVLIAPTGADADINGTSHRNQTIPVITTGTIRKEGASAAAKVAEAESDSTEASQPGDHVDPRALAALLRRGAFDTLEARLLADQEAFDRGELPEGKLTQAYAAFENSDPALRAKLDEWVAHSPKSFVPLLARGTYFRHSGWIARGESWVRDTPPERLMRLALLHKAAKRDLQAALAIHPGLSIAYAGLISIATSSGGNTRAWLDAGLAAVPHSSTIRWRFVWALSPQWASGSTSQKRRARRAFFRQLEEDAADYPAALWWVPGIEDYERGFQAYIEGDLEEAIAHLNAALEKSAGGATYQLRGEVYGRLSKPEKALADANTVLALWPHSRGALQLRAYVYRARGEMERALADWEHFMALDSHDPRYLLDMVETIRLASRDVGRTDRENGVAPAMRPPCLPDDVSLHRPVTFRIDNPTPAQWEMLCSVGAALDRAMVYGAEMPRVRAERGRFFLFTARWPARALEEYRAAAALDPDNPKYRNQIAVMLRELDDCDATEAYREFLAMCEAGTECNSTEVYMAELRLENDAREGWCAPEADAGGTSHS